MHISDILMNMPVMIFMQTYGHDKPEFYKGQIRSVNEREIVLHCIESSNDNHLLYPHLKFSGHYRGMLYIINRHGKIIYYNPVVDKLGKEGPFFI